MQKLENDIARLDLDSPLPTRPDLPRCSLCNGRVYLFEILTVAGRPFHRRCYRATQLHSMELRHRRSLHKDAGILFHRSSSVSVPSSPSPVRSAVTSPQHAGTIKYGSRTLSIGRMRQTRSVSPPPRPPLPLKLTYQPLKVEKIGSMSNKEEILEVANVSDSEKQDQSYPEDLNPFRDDCSDGNIKAVYVTNYTEFQYPTSDPTSNLDNSTQTIQLPPLYNSSLRRSRSYKRRAPNPPDVAELLSPPASSATGVYNLSPKVTSSNHSDSSPDRKSFKSKREAPPVPIPPKRNVQSDPNEEFIPYAQIHAKLYAINKQLCLLEASARDLQITIKNASGTKRAGDLLDRWLNIVNRKDELFKQESELIQRLRRQELEERHGELEHELRLLLSKQDALKTEEEKIRERELLDDLMHTVEERAKIIEQEVTDPHKSKSSDSSRVAPKKSRKIICLNGIFPKSRRRAKHIRSNLA